MFDNAELNTLKNLIFPCYHASFIKKKIAFCDGDARLRSTRSEVFKCDVNFPQKSPNTPNAITINTII